ncbi:hypothetical protein ACFIUX_07745 [Oenococcus oeni]|uniref:Uncharacterized protein n=1 Tax=Oenococcus phage phiS11 TaxID=1432847 RepID=V5USL5_9CAUD|nr:hypothetical protein [Oenococcus oeni]YP_009006591.1 hypothetical protein CF81_gp11 [Oenococcus phage phiS11]AHB80350.1 hypothetical protein [Oenococcus phage phiS11]KGH52769.1 hypothetical protein X325_05760 [Oenococcus oeni S11]MDS0176476.1 hypothetical protein [Oenococcus oeni]OIM37043.1 hypothetical protein ATX68_12955 [Oenococcus oeni]OLQ42064.1 hypothetical protein ATX63_09525 [Oenococcus oeni]
MSFNKNLKSNFKKTKEKPAPLRDDFDINVLFRNINRLIQKYGETISKDHGKSLLHKLILEGRISIEELFEYYKLMRIQQKKNLKNALKEFDIVPNNHLNVRIVSLDNE